MTNFSSAGSVITSTSVIQTERGGVKPTPALQFLVTPISREVATRVVVGKHYSKRIGILWEAFGLFENGCLKGVCCFGQPSAPIQKYAFRERDFPLVELSRLVVDPNTKNGASILISQSLRGLESPAAIISYADSAHGHCGIVYQATNWLYTGAVVAHDSLYKLGGEILHPMTIRDRFKVTKIKEWAKEQGAIAIPPKPKHRYFFFIGSKKEKQQMRDKLRYSVVPNYPKKDKETYESLGVCADYL